MMTLKEMEINTQKAMWLYKMRGFELKLQRFKRDREFYDGVESSFDIPSHLKYLFEKASFENVFVKTIILE